MYICIYIHIHRTHLACATPLARVSWSRANRYPKLWKEAPEPRIRTPERSGAEGYNQRYRYRYRYR